MTLANRLLIVLAMLALAAGCSSAGSSSPTEAAAPSATQGGPGSSEPAAAAPVEVTGTETCEEHSIGHLEVQAECVDTMSDQRVSGSADAYILLETDARPTDMSGTLTLVNEGGTWEGDWSGEITANGNHVIDAVLVGGGDYEGLRYRVHWEGTEFPFTGTGTIEPVS